MRTESDINEKRLTSSVRERSSLPPSDNTRPDHIHRFYKVDKDTGTAQEITPQARKPLTSMALNGENVAKIHNGLESDRAPEIDPKISRLWALYQTARDEYTSCSKGSPAHNKAARFLRDTIENGLAYIETAYPFVVFDDNSENFRGANCLEARNKWLELRSSLDEVTPVVEKAYGRRRFESEQFQPAIDATERKQRVYLHHRDREADIDRANGSHHGAHRDPIPRDSEAIPETVRKRRRSRSPLSPRLLGRHRVRSRSRSRSGSLLSSRYPPRTRSPPSSTGLYCTHKHAANYYTRKFGLEHGSLRERLAARYASFSQDNDLYRPTY